LNFIICTLAAVGLLLAVPPGALANGEPIEFSLPRLDGGDLAVGSLRGSWVVLNYWATWCAPCRKEIPELSELHDRRADLVVLGLAYEEAEPGDFDAFLEEFHVSYPILLVDVYAPPEPFGAPLVMPTSIVLDPRGRVAKTFVGPVTGEMIEAFIDGSAEH
jgi:thiol-disulfide isomerase/thioredoxin